MSCCFFSSLQIPKALPYLPQHRPKPSLHISSKLNQPNTPNTPPNITQKAINFFNGKGSALAVQAGLLLATLEQPALAVTGENNYEIDYIDAAIKIGAIAFWYLLIMPPIIMNWIRVRMYRRKLLEMYFQFMFVFLFFPGLMLWAPFLNFRKFPRDPTMKYPWSVPEDPLNVPNAFAKYPWAEPEDYDNF